MSDTDTTRKYPEYWDILPPDMISKEKTQLRLPSKKVKDPEFYETGPAGNLVDAVKELGPLISVFHPTLWHMGLLKGIPAAYAAEHGIDRILSPDGEDMTGEYGEADPDAEYRKEKPKVKSDLGKKAQDDIDAEAWRKYGLPLNLHDYGGF